MWTSPTKYPWLTKSLSVGAAAIPLGDVLRSAATLPLVLGGGLALAGPDWAIYAVLAALVVVLGERSGTTGQRVFKSGLALLAGTFAMWFGPATAGSGWLPLSVVMAFSLVSGLMSSFGIAASFAGMQLLVQMSIAGGLALDVSPGTRIVAYLCGGCVAVAGILIQDAFERQPDRYRASLLSLIDVLEELLKARKIGPVDEVAWTRRLDADLAAAEYLVRNARPFSRRTNAEIDRCLVVLGDLSVLVTDAIEGKIAGETLRARLAESRAFVSGQKASSELEGRRRSLSHLTAFQQVSDALCDIDTWRFTLRLEICMACAELLRQGDPLGHSYWLPLTTALILKPDLASVFSRTLQRGVGTIVGMVAGWTVTLVTPGPMLLVPLAVLCSLIPYTVRRSYAWFSVIVTPLVFILLDFVAPTTVDVLVQRLVNTLAACVLVLVVGYLFWPGTWAPNARGQIARISRGLGDLIESPRPKGELAWAQDRLAISQDIARLRLRGDQTDSEPEMMRARGHYWHDIAEALEHVLLEATRNSGSITRIDAIVSWHALHALSSRLLHGHGRSTHLPKIKAPPGDLGEAIVALRDMLQNKVA